MARADLLLDVVRAGARRDHARFRKALEALVTDERGKKHHTLAYSLESELRRMENSGQNSWQMQPLSSGRNEQNSGLFFEVAARMRLDDLILPEVVVGACRELVEEQHRADLLGSNNLEPRHRVLVAGPPGNGKTSLAEALASELGVPLLVVRYESVISSYLGETAVRISRLCEQICTQRCVLFLDEFDVIGKERGDVHETGEIKRVVSSLLLQVDALPSHVVVVTATNHPELLDRAVWRRFQLRLSLPPPTAAQVQEWFRRFEDRLGAKLGVDFSDLAERLHGLSFAEIEQFGLDVQRRYVLGLPDAEVTKVVEERLEQWEHRFSVASTHAQGETG